MKAIKTEVTYPDTVYVLLDANLEYNDQTFDWYGSVLGNKSNYYTSLEEARENAKKRLRADLGNFQIGDLDEWNWPDTEVVEKFLATHDIDHIGLAHGASFGEFIAWCENYGIDWQKHVPQLVSIVELKPNED